MPTYNPEKFIIVVDSGKDSYVISKSTQLNNIKYTLFYGLFNEYLYKYFDEEADAEAFLEKATISVGKPYIRNYMAPHMC